ncbi:hypothetical protein GALL_400300 [mine drainage metagenome]|uniref:Large ribosomal RNA subunit accumulation protein YceD n=1 Tax=mine drainage metagenome TaxID=410659 RepID=A0A1J5Q3L1_9ZZZZ
MCGVQILSWCDSLTLAPMKEYKHPPKIDIRLAAQSPEHLSGRESLSNYKRLMQETQGLGGDKLISWSVLIENRPNATGQPSAWLALRLTLTLPLLCQRCLGLVDVDIDIDRSLRFVDTEAQAEQQDDASEEDLLVISAEFDLAALIEDEVLLDLPLVPRHGICPVPVKLAVADDGFDGAAEKPNAFAVLAQLKGRH